MVTLNIFQKLDEAQNTHGVPVSDYAQYHTYCTKRLDRLRHNKAVRTQLVHNQRYVEGVTGRRRHAYCSRKQTFADASSSSGAVDDTKDSDGSPSDQYGESTNHTSGEESDTPNASASLTVITHENMYWNLFFQAERAWAQACALQQTSSQMVKSKKPKKASNHGYVQRRLNKAAKWATDLYQASTQSLSEGLSCDEQTVKECQAYAAWMQGNAALEHKYYAPAYHHYQEALVILLELAATPMAADENNVTALAVRDLWTARAESVVRPLVRYCQYEAKDELSDADVAPFAQLTNKPSSAATTSTSASSIVLYFRGQDVALDSYKQIAVLYLKVEPLLKSPESLDESQFLQLLTDLDDATQLVASEIKQYESVVASSSSSTSATATTGPAVAAKLSSLRAVHAYFRYQKLSIWRYQQELRVAALTSDAEIVHVYDALQQNAIAMAELPVTEDGTSNNDDDPYCLEAQAHVVRIRAWRCYYLARLYESTLNGTEAQILALLKHSETLSRRATEEIAASDTIAETEAEAHLQALTDLVLKIKAMRCRVEATKYLETSADGFATSTQRPLWLRLDEMDSGPVLADDPPLPIPMPCKGVFYDIAWQHVTSPVAALEDYIALHETKKSRGFLSWFGSG
jgi:RNA-binding signal recognition particle 68